MLRPAAGVLFLGLTSAAAQPTAASATAARIQLSVPAGAPLRAYLTKRVTKKLGQPVEAKLIDPLFAFDQQVAPAGSRLLGKVVRLEPVSKFRRVSAILGGDFTPLHQAEIRFSTLVLPGGAQIPLQTVETPGLTSIFDPRPPRKRKAQSASNNTGNNTGVLGTAKQQVQDQVNARVYGVIDVVRAPDKKEKLAEYFLMKLPYHPQWVRKGTRIDAELSSALAFGETTLQPAAQRMLASQPPLDSVVHARLTAPLDSRTATQGEKVEALLTQPLFSPNHQLILPEGSRLSGSVTLAHRARWFHRGGQLRFRFENIDMPAGVKIPELMAEKRTTKTQAQVEGAESGGNAALKVDQEGTVKATESKTRFLAPALALLVASKSADNDAGRHTASGASEPNVSGRTLGGGLGFGLLGSIAAQKSQTFGKIMGFYGLAWSVYLNVVARGSEVEFGRNAAVDIRFGGRRPPQAASKFVAQANP